MKKEFLIGLLFLIALSATGYVTAVVQNFNPFREARDIVVVFQRINGLKVDDQVLYSGSHIGYVKDIKFNENYEIDVILSINNNANVAIPGNALITIEDRTVLGGKQISIKRPAIMGVELAPGEKYKGIDPQPILANAAETLTKIGDGFDSLKELLDGDGTIPQLFKDDSIMNDLKATFKNVADISKKINEDKGSDGGTLSQLVNDPTLYNDIKEFTGKLNQLHIDLMVDYHNFPEDNYSFTHAGVRLETDPKKFYDLKASILTTNHETRIATTRTIARQEDTVIYPTVLLGRRFLEHNNLELSAGMLEGEIGGRASFYMMLPEDRIGFHFEGRSRIKDKDIRENNENLMARLYVDYEMKFQNFPTLRISGGAHNIFDDVQGFIGVGFQFRDDDLKYLVATLSGGS